MPHEREVKFDVASFEGVRRRLRAAGAKYLGTLLQTDVFFDTPTGQLRKSDQGFRVRQVRVLRSGRGRLDRRPLLTYKGPRRNNANGLKVRREIEMHLDDADAAVRMIRAMGMRRHMTIQKRRASYRLGRCLVELDELPLIGRFVEIEGPTEKAILAAARQLKLQSEPIMETYSSLLEAEGGRRARSKRNFTFTRR